MNPAEMAALAFLVLNVVRVLAYAPQVVRILIDRSHASAISLTTWTLFAASNLATTVYAHGVIGDGLVAVAFLANTFGCVAIIGATVWKRAVFRRAMLMPDARPDMPVG